MSIVTYTCDTTFLHTSEPGPRVSIRTRLFCADETLELPGKWTLYYEKSNARRDYTTRYGFIYSNVPPNVKILGGLLEMWAAGNGTAPLKSTQVPPGAGEGIGSLQSSRTLSNAKYRIKLSIYAGVAESGPGSTARAAVEISSTQIPIVNDVALCFPYVDRTLWATSDALSDASPHFKNLFSSGFAEGALGITLSPAEEKTLRVKHRVFEDSDDESDDSLPLPPRRPPHPLLPSPPFHQVIIRDTSYTTYAAVLCWIQCRHIQFAPLASTFDSSEDRLEHLQESSSTPTSATAGLPHPASPKSVFRLAHYLEIDELKKLALQAMKVQITTENAGYELVGDVSRCYDEVQKMVMEFVADNWAAVSEGKAMKELERKIESDDLPGAVGVAGVFVKLAKRLKMS